MEGGHKPCLHEDWGRCCRPFSFINPGIHVLSEREQLCGAVASCRHPLKCGAWNRWCPATHNVCSTGDLDRAYPYPCCVPILCLFSCTTAQQEGISWQGSSTVSTLPRVQAKLCNHMRTWLWPPPTVQCSQATAPSKFHCLGKDFVWSMLVPSWEGRHERGRSSICEQWDNCCTLTE